LDHFPVLLELSSVGKKPPNPFKFNPRSLDDEDFIKLVKAQWVPFDGTMRESAAIQFAAILKKVKQAAITWAHMKKERDKKNLIEVEAKFDLLYNSERGGYLNEESKAEVQSLEQLRRKLLAKR